MKFAVVKWKRDHKTCAEQHRALNDIREISIEVNGKRLLITAESLKKDSVQWQRANQ